MLSKLLKLRFFWFISLKSFPKSSLKTPSYTRISRLYLTILFRKFTRLRSFTIRPLYRPSRPSSSPSSWSASASSWSHSYHHQSSHHLVLRTPPSWASWAHLGGGIAMCVVPIVHSRDAEAKYNRQIKKEMKALKKKKIIDSEQLVKSFESMSHHGDLDFEFVYKVFLDAGITDKSFVEHVFEMIDTDHDHTIHARELAAVLILFTEGSFDDRLKWLFRLFDEDGDGYVSRDEFQKGISAIIVAHYHLHNHTHHQGHDGTTHTHGQGPGHGHGHRHRHTRHHSHGASSGDPLRDDLCRHLKGIDPSDYSVIARYEGSRMTSRVFRFAALSDKDQLTQDEFVRFMKKGDPRDAKLVYSFLFTTLGAYHEMGETK